MKILITGINGFIGGYLAEYALRQGCSVSGLDRPGVLTGEGVQALGDRVRLRECDLLSKESVLSVLEEVRPDRIFHLAAKSNVSESWNCAAETIHNNVLGQSNLFEAVKESGMRPQILIAASSEIYGLVKPEEIPVSEDALLRPVSPYAVSKAAQDLMGYQFYQNTRIPVFRSRAFNQTGPRRDACFVTSSFARQTALIEAGKQEPVVRAGNLDAVRDFTDARDAVEAYWLCAERCEPGEAYNICSGRGVRIGDILGILRRISGVSFEVARDSVRQRQGDLPAMIGSNKKFRKRTGWEPRIGFETSMKDLLDEWRRKIHENAGIKN